MAQIVRKKDDNMVLFLFDDLDNITVDSDGLSVNLCSTPRYQVDMTGSLVTDTDYEILTVVQPHLPRRIYGVEVDKWDGTTWTQDADALVLFRANEGWQEPLPHNLV